MTDAYPRAQWARALQTALEDPDPTTRNRALGRASAWQRVLEGMASGRLRVGSRQPTVDLPVWVTLEVLHGGFSTGRAVAGGAVTTFERELAGRRVRQADVRAEAFTAALTPEGLGRLATLLDSGAYRIDVPEHGALLAVTWLARAGDLSGAAGLVRGLLPFAHLLCFLPVPEAAVPADPGTVWRRSAGDVVETLGRKREPKQVAVMNETLAVWNPFADEVLAHWLRVCDQDGRPGRAVDDAWRARGRHLLERYRGLVAQHPGAGKHRRPGENLNTLLVALEEVVRRPLDARRLGQVQVAVNGMLGKRGRPGTPALTRLRREQELVTALPRHHVLAQILAGRLSGAPSGQGLDDPARFCEPVDIDEATRFDVPVGAPLPTSMTEAVRSAQAGTPEFLTEHGVLPSAEELARLVPRIAAHTTAQGFPDHAAQILAARIYEAFRRRRSLLLVDLQKQVQLEELPWMEALSRHHADGADDRSRATAALVRLAELAVATWPGTLLPNPLVREMSALAKAGGLDLPLVEELAADIFMGTFSAGYRDAAARAEAVVRGSLYARYFDVDAATVSAVTADSTKDRKAGRPFAQYCRARAGVGSSRGSVAENGAVIEQAQVLTTHNLALLAGELSMAPAGGWAGPAGVALAETRRLLRRAASTSKPLRVVKDAAYSWRQAVFYLSRLPGTEATAVIEQAFRDSDGSLPADTAFIALLGDLEHPDEARPFYGWSHDGPHPILTAMAAR